MALPLETLLDTNRPFLGAVAFLLGTIVGSFINVVSLRLPKMMEKSWRNQCAELLHREDLSTASEAPFNLAFPPSHCPGCQHAIRAWENIPVISYVLLGGKCSGCKKPISVRYPAVELAAGILSGLAAWHLGATTATVAIILLTWSLLTLAIIDFDTQFLPDDITLPLLWIGLLLNVFSLFATLQDAVIGAAAGYLCLWAVYWIFKLLTHKEGMGYGDFKLLAALGAWLGWQSLPIIILISSCVGSVIGIALILFKGRDSQMPLPFGPFLAAAGWLCAVWYTDLVTLFNSIFQG